ncbi:MAG: hypothetical protein ABI672_17475, partial [Vicinamibacteria bacterium]
MNVFRSVALTVVLLTALSTSGLAQETKAPEAGPASAEKPQTAPPAPPVAPAKAARATDFTLGLGYHGVTHLTGSATLMWGTARMFGALAPGKLIQVRGGARGGQVGVGFVGGAFEESPIRPSGVAATFKAILIRTWRDPT